MISRFVPVAAIAIAAAFFGIAVYITVAEQPARLLLGDGPSLEQWQHSFRVAIVLQGTMAILGGVAGLLAFWHARDGRWLAGGLLMLANWPWTLLMIQPINTALLAATAGTPQTRALIEQWGAVHGMRTLLSGIALLLLIWAGMRTAMAKIG